MDLPEDGLSDSDLTAILDSIAPSNAPTVKDELARKSSDALDWLIGRYDRGEMSAEACSAAADALFMSLSGLVNSDLVDVITAMGSWLPSNKPEKSCRIFRREGRTLTVTWRPGEPHLTFLTPEGAMSRRENDNPKEARKMFSMLGDTLTKHGYTELEPK